jgi:ABC-type Fe3+ transport system substrate-binding protein
LIRGYFASKNFRIGIVLWFLFLAAAFPARSWAAAADSIADLHDKARKEGGKLALEGAGEVGGVASILKGAPHPNTALLWARWVTSEEGQRVYAEAGETPAHPNVEPLEKVRPTAAYMLSIDDIKEFPKYEKLWKEIFQIR